MDGSGETVCVRQRDRRVPSLPVPLARARD